MKNKTKILIAFLLMGILALNMAMAEINVYGFNSATGNNETKQSLYITLQDSGNTQTGKKADTNFTAKITHYVNYTFSNNATLISCFLREQQIKNTYAINGDLINSTIETNIIPYNYSAESLRYYNLRDKDILQLDLHCFYDIDIDNTLFQYLSESVVGLQISTASYTCGSCARGDFEEIINDYMDAKKTTADQITIYGNIASITDYTTDFWLVIYWTLRIFLFLLLVGLIFAFGFWLVGFLQRMSQK